MKNKLLKKADKILPPTKKVIDTPIGSIILFGYINEPPEGGGGGGGGVWDPDYPTYPNTGGGGGGESTSDGAGGTLPSGNLSSDDQTEVSDAFWAPPITSFVRFTYTAVAPTPGWTVKTRSLGNYKSASGTGQLCGSHELRMDYYSRTVLAVRFPVNVMEALTNAPWHAQLHPTTAITRNAFYACNKFSEERTFGNDTKFLLYSYFVLKDIKNIDEFLYIRKRHSGTLTTLPETHLDSPVRQQLLNTWNSDFGRIKSGRLKLKDSSLNYEVSKLDYKVKKP